jgi:regulator of sigma E protease
MISQFFLAFFSLLGLLVLHEFGHFILAKLFKVKVEEFGIGYPPKIIGKKFGETIYSLNFLPFGAFVKILGEEKKIESLRSFSEQPLLKRILIAFGGVLSFWIFSAILLSFTFNLGTLIAIEDTTDSNLINPKVQIAQVSANSPAYLSGLRPGDTIKQFKISDLQFPISKIKEVQELTEKYKGQEITLTIERGKDVLDIKLTPRVSPPQGEGAMGIALVRTVIQKFPLHQAILKGISGTLNLTWAVLQGYGQAVSNIIKGLPSGVQVTGPVGIFYMVSEASQLGLSYFLNFIALICIYLAIFNLLPIPAADGGKLLFLGIEAVRKKPINQEIEQRINTAFFMAIIALSIWVTIQDINRIF